MLVADAVRASMSIPFVYKPVKLRDLASRQQIWLVDGGLLSNFPVEIFDREQGNPPRWPTFALAEGTEAPARHGSRRALYRPGWIRIIVIGTISAPRCRSSSPERGPKGRP